MTSVSLAPGAALGPLLAGLLSAGGWNQVFYMLMTADFLALLVCTCCCCCCPAPPPGVEDRRWLVTCFASLFFSVQLLLRLVAKELSSSQSHPITAMQWVSLTCTYTHTHTSCWKVEKTSCYLWRSVSGWAKRVASSWVTCRSAVDDLQGASQISILLG